MWLRLVFVFCVLAKYSFASKDEGVIYDKYTAKPVSEKDLAEFESKGITGTCTVLVRPCNESEGRRTDGTCNNLKYPSMGAFMTPLGRLLEPNYVNGNKTRKSEILSRVVRTNTLTVGKSINQHITQAVNAFIANAFGDYATIQDVTFYLHNKTDCCNPKHMDDEMCSPISIPEDDDVHSFSGIRCLNHTTPLTQQYLGCTKDITPAPYAQATSVLDLSQIYNALGEGDAVVRSFEGGKLRTETDEDGIVWPPSGDAPMNCLGNKPDETKCFAHHGAELLLTTVITITQIRNHNYYATELAKVNPCWDDEKLFQKARELNIATFLWILYQEWLPVVTGEDFLIKKGLTKKSMREDHYDETKPSQVMLESTYILRYFHILQEPMAYKYDDDGKIIGNMSQTEFFMRPGFLAKDGNLKKFTPNLYLQPAAAGLRQIDPDMADHGLPPHMQLAVDLPTSDVHKSYVLGLAPYCDYVRYYTGKEIKTWNDLKTFMNDESIMLLQRIYPSVRHIGLMDGAWMEEKLEGGQVPLIVANIIFDQFIRFMITDRLWFGRKNSPVAFTDNQYNQIEENVSLASVLCRNADGVKSIQRNAFKVISDTNPLVSCSEIPTIDFSHFAECQKS